MMPNKELWIDTRLSSEEMDFLWGCISEERVSLDDRAAESNKSKLIKDKDNWFYENVLKKHTERLFYDDWKNYRKYHIVKEHPLPKFEMNRFWVNYQKQYEFNPLHHHSPCLYSFVIFMKIPTHWEEQHEMNNDEFRARVASDFVFVWGSENMEQRGNVFLNTEKNDLNILKENFQLSPEDEGRMIFFPSWLQHMVYPFYGTEEERVTISGNTILNDPNRSEEPKTVKLSGNVYEEKEKMLKIMENSVKVTKEELKQMKKLTKKK